MKYFIMMTFTLINSLLNAQPYARVENQPSLSNWQPDKLLMERKSDYIREITLQLQSPAELKFTRGSWETQAEVKYNYGLKSIKIDPCEKINFEFEIIYWMGDM